jgi:hypothetical protein
MSCYLLGITIREARKIKKSGKLAPRIFLEVPKRSTRQVRDSAIATTNSVCRLELQRATSELGSGLSVSSFKSIDLNRPMAT